jgi:site-specific DNA-cytosine methylase
MDPQRLDQMTISLDPGVGFSFATENQSSDQQRALHAELIIPENQPSGSRFGLFENVVLIIFKNIFYFFKIIFNINVLE